MTNRPRFAAISLIVRDVRDPSQSILVSPPKRRGTDSHWPFHDDEGGALRALRGIMVTRHPVPQHLASVPDRLDMAMDAGFLDDGTCDAGPVRQPAQG